MEKTQNIIFLFFTREAIFFAKIGNIILLGGQSLNPNKSGATIILKFSRFLAILNQFGNNSNPPLVMMYRVYRSDLQLIWCQYDKWEMQVKINNQHKDICLHKSMEIMRREREGHPDDNYEAGSLTYINMSSDDAQHMTVTMVPSPRVTWSSCYASLGRGCLK